MTAQADIHPAVIPSEEGAWRRAATPLLLLVPALFLLAAFFAYPLSDVVARSFRGPEGLTLSNYAGFFQTGIYLRVLLITLEIAFYVTVLALLLGYPLAYMMANARAGLATLLMVIVLIPFFTSILVRTYGWMVILRPNGVLSSLLAWLGFGQVQLIYNRTGVLIGMVYTMLPYMVLTLYSVMKGIDRSLTRVALSLGASPWFAFRRVYLPLSMPGVAAGSLLVFIISIGFYITPRLLGGDRDQMLATIIAFEVDSLLRWNIAAALSVILLLITLICFALYARLVGIRQLLTSKF